MKTNMRKLYKKVKLHEKTNKIFSDRLFQSYKLLKNEYLENCLKTKNTAWRTKMSELDCVKNTAKLVKILENGTTEQISSLAKPNGTFTNSNEESNDLLMKTHFPDCTLDLYNEEENIFHSVDPSDFDEIEDSISTDEIIWAMNSLSPFKSPGEDGPALLQKAENVVVPILQEFFRISLRLGYIPKSWRETFVKFIPKAAKARYDTPKAFRPISLMSFILKTLEKLVDHRLRNKTLVNSPLHNSQHAYQPGKGTESALHNLVSEVEKYVFNQGMSLSVFVDIEGVFDNTSFETITKAAENKGTEKWAVN
jgi:Reverse transcriptase (RNA-dependent DNA polymerase)